MVEHQFFGDSTAHENRQRVVQELFGMIVAVVGGQLHGDSQCTAPWNNRHLVNRIGARQYRGH